MKIYQLPDKTILIADGDLREIEMEHQFLGLDKIVALNPPELSPHQVYGNPRIALLEDNGSRIFYYADERDYIRWEPWMADHITSIFEMLVKAHRQGYEDGYEDT